MFTRNVPRTLLLLVTIAALMVVFGLSGCTTKSKVDDTTGGGTGEVDSVVVSASPSTLSTSVTAVVEALVLSGGSPVADAEVTFSVSPALSGTFSQSVDTSGADGIAATIFTPSTFGEITITATAGGQISGTATLNIDVEEPHTGNGFVWLTVTPRELLTDAPQTADVRIEVRDSAQAPVAAGTEVVIVAGEKFIDEDGDGYYTAGTDQLVGDLDDNGWWDAFGTIDSVAYTDAGGLINLTYSGLSTEPRTVYIRATIRDDAISGFDKDSIEFAAYTPPEGHVWVTAAPNVFVAGREDTATIRIEVRDDLQQPAPAGTQIRIAAGERFTDVDGNGWYTPAVDILSGDENDNGWWDAFGTIDTTAVTDANGVVTLTYITGLGDETVYIKATVSELDFAGSDEEAITFVPYIPVEGFVWITADDTLLVADGSDATTLRIQVRGPDEQPAPANTPVYLAAGEKFSDVDGNGYFTAGTDQLVIDHNGNGWWDSFGTIVSSALTDANGTVTLNYTAGTEPYDIYVKATVNTDEIKASAEIKLTQSVGVGLHTIYLSSDSMQLSVIETGGIQTSTLRCVAYDNYGNPVPAGYPISFQILDGPGGGEHLFDQVTDDGPYLTETDDMGAASVPLTSGTLPGTIRARASSGSVLSNAIQILVSAGPPYRIDVAVDTCNVPFWNTVNGENGVVAIISDYHNNPVNDSTVAYFTCNEGVVKSHENRTENLDGIVTSTWRSWGPSGTGRVWIYAETAGGTVVDSVMFFNSYVPDTLMVSGVPATMVLDGKAEANLWITSIDGRANPIIAGTPFDADATYLNVAGAEFEDGCNVAWARVTITSTTLDYDYSATGGNDDGIGAIDEIVYYYGIYAVTSYNVTLLTGDAYRGNCSINGPSTVTGGELVELSATVKDRWGNPLADHTLNMTASGGVVANATQETDQYGEASGFRWTAPGGEGDFTITITDTDPRGGITFTKTISVSI